MRGLACLLISMWLSASGTGTLAKEVYVTAGGQRVGDLDVFQECDVCPEMIVLPLGEFRMGSSVAEAIDAYRRFFSVRNIDPNFFQEELRHSFVGLGIDPDSPEEGLVEYYTSGRVRQREDPQYSIVPTLHEVPAHRVAIDLPIAMGRNEVTRAEWAACVQDGGCERGQLNVVVSDFTKCEKIRACDPTPDARIAFRLQKEPLTKHPLDPRQPKVGVTFHEMQDYVSWLNEKVGADVYRLPTEAEWEYAARAGTTTRFAQGNTLTQDQANFAISSRKAHGDTFVWEYDPGNAGRLLPVDQLDAANGWGLRHMSGNASEVTGSCGAGPHRGLSTSSAYLEADKGHKDCKRSVKGGFYLVNIELLRPARRVALPSDHWSVRMGFRVARDLQPRDHTKD